VVACYFLQWVFVAMLRLSSSPKPETSSIFTGRYRIVFGPFIGGYWELNFTFPPDRPSLPVPRFSSDRCLSLKAMGAVQLSRRENSWPDAD